MGRNTFATGYDPAAAYGQYKRATVLFTRTRPPIPLQKIGPSPPTPESQSDPDPTTLSRIQSYRAQGLVDQNSATIIDPAAGKKTIEQGAAMLVFGVANPILESAGGVHLKDNDIAVLDDQVRALTADNIHADANSAMLNPDDARRLWQISDALLVQTAPARPTEAGRARPKRPHRRRAD